MSLVVDVLGGPSLDLHYLLIDVNGTLSNRGTLIDGVNERLRKNREVLEVRLLSADLFGDLADISAELGLDATPATNGGAKRDVIAALGSGRCVAIGNGANDEAMLREAALGIAVIGAEGAATATLAVADLVTRSVIDALDLLLYPRERALRGRPAACTTR
jgi:soluble P-type ATPase